jgi:hypothetical protein
LSIALDGISNHEDLAAVRDRVTLLPPELNEMFTHILTKRIPHHHKQEAFRCIFITFVWHSESARRPHRVDLSHMVVSVARQASSYTDACSLASATTLESAQYSRNRLVSRCQGLLEISVGEETHGEVTFLHRTLLDYLREDQAAQDLLQAGLGDTFDVYTAVMAGLICTRKFHPHTRRTMGRIFFYFNMLAERSTGQSRSVLIEIFDQFESSLYAGSARTLKDARSLRHWSNDYIKTQLPTESSLLIWAAYCGATLFVQESIEKDGIPDVRTLSQLLYFALMPIFPGEEMSENRHVEPNLAVSALLIGHGADPAYDVAAECPWTLVLRFVVGTSDVGQRDSKETFDMMAAALRALVMFARGAPDVQKCSALRIFNLKDDTFYVAAEALDRFVLERRCCRGYRVRTCQCRRARSLRPVAMEVLELVEAKRKINSETAGAQDQHAETRYFRNWSVKKLLLRRK